MPAVVKIGAVEIGATPRVVGVLSAPLTLDRLASGYRPVCDVIEFRVDLLGAGTPDWLVRAVETEQAGLPVLVTLRHPREGGHWYGTEEERIELYHRVLPHVSAIDFEIRSAGFSKLVAHAHAARKPVIASFHDFNGLPADAVLRAVVEEGRAAAADIIKIAAVVREESDLARMEKLLDEHSGPPLCLLGMGPLGAVSRTRLPLRGSCLAYGFVDEANVPGQPSSAELVEFLKNT